MRKTYDEVFSLIDKLFWLLILNFSTLIKIIYILLPYFELIQSNSKAAFCCYLVSFLKSTIFPILSDQTWRKHSDKRFILQYVHICTIWYVIRTFKRKMDQNQCFRQYLEILVWWGIHPGQTLFIKWTQLSKHLMQINGGLRK